MEYKQDLLFIAALDASQEGIFAVDHDLNIRLWNRTMEALTQFRRSEVINRNLLEVLPFLKGTNEVQLLRSAINGVEQRSLRPQYFSQMSDKVFEAHYTPGEGKTCVGVIRNLSAENTERARLDASDKLFRIMADNAPVLLWMARPDGRCYFFNKRWTDFTGRSIEEELDYGWSEGVHAEDFQYCMDTFTQALSRRAPFNMEYRLRRHDGTYRWVYDLGVPWFQDEDQFGGYIGSCVDVTEKIEYKEERELILKSEQAARAEQERLIGELNTMNRLKDEFLGTVSHELRNPLNAIMGWSEIFLGDDYDQNEFQMGIESIHRNAQLNLKLVSDLLDISKIISGKMEIRSVPVDLVETISNAINTVELSAQAKNITVVFNKDPSVGPTLGDPDRLQQVLWNILGNAIRHTPIGGAITVNLKRNAKCVYIEIIDTGEGIDPNFLPFVFDRFRQADGSVTRRHGGLGIGLSIAKSIIELHGGVITVESEGKGKGAYFKIALPITTVRLSPENENDHTSRSKPLRGYSVLAVDDQVDALVLIQTLLSKAGAKVHAATSVQEALDQVKDAKIDIILTDIGMPGEGGYDLMRKLRLDRKFKELPVVALTAHARQEDRDYALSLGFKDHLTKPYDASTVVGSLMKLVSRKV